MKAFAHSASTYTTLDFKSANGVVAQGVAYICNRDPKEVPS